MLSDCWQPVEHGSDCGRFRRGGAQHLSAQQAVANCARPRVAPDSEARPGGGTVPVERFVGFRIDDAVFGQVTYSSRDRRREQGRVERRIEKDHIPALIRSSACQPLHGVGVFDGGSVGGEPRPVPEKMADRIAVVVDEGGVAGASRQCLETEDAGSRKEVEYAGTRQFRPKPIEQCDPGPGRRRSDGGTGHG